MTSTPVERGDPSDAEHDDTIDEAQAAADPVRTLPGLMRVPRATEQVPPSDPMLGLVLDGRFQLIRRIGEGAMGLVYEGVQLSIGRPVAIKILRPPGDLDSTELAKRFLREARVLTSLSHPNIVAVFDFGQTSTGVMYLVMELLRGETLAEELARCGRFGWRRACEVGIQVCHALVAAHGNGIVHRDLKPDNVLLVDYSHGDVVKVVDFGLAKPTAVADRFSAGEITMAGAFVGTPYYLAPEVISGAALDPQIDLYALGCLLHELLSGSPPFASDSIPAVLTQHLIAAPPPLPADVPDELAAAVDALLAKSPAARPAVAEVAARLQAILAEHTEPPSDLDEVPTLVAASRVVASIPTTPPSPPATPTIPTIAAAPKRVVVVALVVATMLVVAAIAYLIVSRALV